MLSTSEAAYLINSSSEWIFFLEFSVMYSRKFSQVAEHFIPSALPSLSPSSSLSFPTEIHMYTNKQRNIKVHQFSIFSLRLIAKIVKNKHRRWRIQIKSMWFPVLPSSSLISPCIKHNQHQTKLKFTFGSRWKMKGTRKFIPTMIVTCLYSCFIIGGWC